MPAPDTPLTVLRVFLRLGLTSFGGPIAHLGYFRTELVVRRQWVSDAQFAQLVALCQLLPGPTSSQVGMAIALTRAGAWGAVASFVGFTAPSALLMYAIARSATAWPAGLATRITQALTLVALAVVAHALWRMAQRLLTDAPRAGIALLTGTVVTFVHHSLAQVLALGLAATAGLALRLSLPQTSLNLPAFGVSRRAASIAGGVLLILVAAALLLPVGAPSLATLALQCARAGALVFGGAHVVLPMLEQSFVSAQWVSADALLAGYGAAQLMPGPLFSVAAYLGAVVPVGVAPWIAAGLAVLAIYTPGVLALVAVLPAWGRLVANARAQRALAGLSAGVVGLLAAVFAELLLRNVLR
ncbi:MAG: chromate efflux transporter [Gemmatimonadaceae bacterium]|nr:chromate efflux transporter [Gemmatimonadaceae bacterium]